MTITINKNPNEKEWQFFRPQNINQHWDYGEIFNKISNLEVFRWIFYTDSKPIAAIQGHVIKTLGVKRKLIIGGHGGESIYISTEAPKEIWHDILREISTLNLPSILIYTTLEQGNLFSKFGFSETIDHSCIVDINNVESLWVNLDKKNRNAIRFAERSGVEFERVVSLDKLNITYKLMKNQAERWDINPPTKTYLQVIWDNLVKKDLANFFLAKCKDEYVSGALIFNCNEILSLPIWGNTNAAKPIRANNFLQWAIIKWANKQGYKTYDLCGANPNPAGKLYGIYKFKESFGSKLVTLYCYEKKNWLGKLAYR